MGVILIDGPEGAGKTTLIAEAREFLSGSGVRSGYHHWHQPGSYADYLRVLYVDLLSGDPVFWDRGWPSDVVYGELLPAGSRKFQADAWLGEWLLGRATMTAGLRVVLVPDVDTLIRRREERDDPTDHKVSPLLERALYVDYGRRFDYEVLPTMDPEDLASLAVEWGNEPCGKLPPRYVGSPAAKVVFVGEARKENSPFPLPFVTPMTTQYGRLLGDAAMECGWTNVDADPDWVSSRELVVACGDEARKWCRALGARALEVPHPAYLYRWARGRQMIERTERDITLLVSQALGRDLTPAPPVAGAFPGYVNEARFRAGVD